MAESLLSQSLALLLLLAGAGLIVAEAFAPGAHFIVLGVALLVAGLVGLFLPAGPFAPLVLAGLVIGVGAVTLYAYRKFDIYGGKGSGRTTDSDSLRGQTGRVTERVTETSGEVKLDDGGFNPYYSARSLEGEIAEGEKVLVVEPGGGNVVTVESMSRISRDEIDRELERARRRNEREGTDGGDPDGAGDGADDPETDLERESA